MRIKELIKQDKGFQYVIDNMELMSAAGRRKMLDTEFCTDTAQLQQEWQRLDEAVRATREFEYKKPYIDLRHCLMQLHDLKGTLTSLANHTPLNEVELFEIKNLAQLTGKASVAISGLGMNQMLPLPDLSEVFQLLDPDHTGLTHFYIYDSYDPRLPGLRRLHRGGLRLRSRRRGQRVYRQGQGGGRLRLRRPGLLRTSQRPHPQLPGPGLL